MRVLLPAHPAHHRKVPSTAGNPGDGNCSHFDAPAGPWRERRPELPGNFLAVRARGLGFRVWI